MSHPKLALTLCLLLPLAGCDRSESPWLQGYVEGEFVYVSSAVAGSLQTLAVQRGSEVKAGSLLFTLEDGLQRAAHDEAEHRLAQARANLEDLTKGRRPTEIAAIDAQLRQAQTALTLADKESQRQQELVRTGATSTENAERARSTAEQSQARVGQLEAELATAKLGARADQIAAAEAATRAAEAALKQAAWTLAQTRQSAPQGGQIFDTLYRTGEWVLAGRPVVALLPPENLKVRFFVPESRLAALRHGQIVSVRLDGAPPFSGTVSFISPKAEYTPPVIYSAESRAKLVFMVEVVFAPDVAARLHPGQPVDVLIDPPK